MKTYTHEETTDEAEYYSADIVVKIYNNNGGLIFCFTCSPTKHCCGIIEIGKITTTVDYGSPVAKDKNFLSELDNAITDLYDNCTNLDDGEIKLMANLVDSDACRLLADSFKRTGLFEQKLNFINDNTSNVVTVWFSV